MSGLSPRRSEAQPREPTTETMIDVGERDVESPHPQIYLASLSDYTAGELHGAWIDAAQPAEDLHVEAAAMLAASPTTGAEEWAIHDYSGFGTWHPGEYENLDTIASVAAAIVEHGPAMAEWLSYYGSTDPDIIEVFDDAYLGAWESLEVYAEHLIDEIGLDVTVDPPSWKTYLTLNTDLLVRDLECQLYTARLPDGTVAVFNPNVT